MTKRNRGKYTGSNVIKTYNQYLNLDFQNDFEWNDEQSYPVNLRAAIKSLEAHNNVVLSGDALDAANDPEIYCILPSNRGTLLWMYNNALDTKETLQANMRFLSEVEVDECACGRVHTEQAKTSKGEESSGQQLSDTLRLIDALEATLTCMELTKVRSYRSHRITAIAGALLLGGLFAIATLFIPTNLFVDTTVLDNASPRESIVISLMVLMMQGVLVVMSLAIGSLLGFILFALLEVRQDKRLTKQVNSFTDADDADYLDWDVPGLTWNNALTDDENKEAIVKAIEAHNQVVLADGALTAVRQEAKSYYSPKTTKRVPRKQKAEITHTTYETSGRVTVTSRTTVVRGS